MVITEEQKQTIKALFAEWASSEVERKELAKLLQDKLKVVEEYQELLRQKKEISEKVKGFQQSHPDYNGVAICDENIKANKEDLKELLEVKAPILSTLFKQYKSKEGGEDFLDVVLQSWVEVFEDKQPEENN